MTFVTKQPSSTLENCFRGFLIFNDAGDIVMSDPYIDTVFELQKGESIGMPIQKLIPSFNPQLGQKQNFLGTSVNLEPALQIVKGLKKPGIEFSLEVALSHVQIESHTFTVAFLPAQSAAESAEINQAMVDREHMNRHLELQIQKRKLIEEKFIKIQRTYDTIVHNFPDGVIGVLNKEMKYILVDGKDLNDIDLPAMGLTNQTSIGNHDPVVADEILQNLKRAFQGEHVSFEIKASDRIYDINAVPLPDSKGNIHEILCVLRNITQRKHLEDDLRKAVEKEKELGDLKSRFITMASHEFRTPLSTILSSAFLLENFKGDKYENEKKIHIDRIKRGVNTLTMILNEFLAVERFEEYNVPLSLSDINVPDLIKDIIHEMEPLEKEGQTMTYHHEGEFIGHLVDPKLLWSITSNLISNALKYSPHHSEVQVRSEISPLAIKLAVSDTGIGIPKDEHPFLFERFYRARNASNFEGTGLGLHIVLKCIQMLQGTISFESQLNQGTIFSVTIPHGSRT
ncbi:hypothetical protein BH09BAC3_BH09BAC3_10470 [soil metagenome]